jgi:tetratricopeptide (TPR) repeat protein
VRALSILAVATLVLSAASARAVAADARSAYLSGAAAQGVEDYELAVEKYKEALGLNPSYLEPMAGLAESYLAMAEYEEAGRWVTAARSNDPSSPSLAVLDGRVHIGQGNVPAARTLFSQVLAKEPNNVDARLGMAEADIAEGRTQSALDRYTQALGLAPESTKALLSLAMLAQESGDTAGAARYYELALKSHSSDAHVQLAAASWYASTGSFGTAEKHAQVALSLAPGLEGAKILLGQVYLQTKRYADAVSVLGGVVSANRDNAVAWYALGLAYRRAGDAAKAITSFGSALQARPDDEIARLAQEATALESLAIADAGRRKMAAYHLAQGQAQEQRSYLEKALSEYRRALILDPTSRDARVAYARIFRTLGFPAKFLSEMKVLAGLGVKDTYVSDQIEALTSALSGSVSRAWAYDQYNLDRRRYSIQVSTLPAQNRLVHPLASEDAARYFGTLLGRFDAISVPDVPAVVSGFDDAFRAARTAGVDYFLVLGIDEADRSLSVTADVYLARTGSRIASFAGFRTGNDRVRDALMKLASDVAGILSPRGTLLERTFGQGLIDLGTLQGLKAKDALVIVRQGAVRLRSDGPGLAYEESDVLGDFTVTGADELVAEGAVKGRGYFDYVNARDEVLFPIQRAPAPSVTTTQRSGNILTRLFRIGG